MSDNHIDIDSAMNLIKEDIIQELFESVTKQNKASIYQDLPSNKICLSDTRKD